MNIYEKMLAIMQAVQKLQKDDHVQFGSTNYKALSEEKVTTIMREQLLKHGLVIFPIEQQCARSGQITHVDVKYRMVNAENPDEYIEICSCGDGADSQDKGSGKAMTYAYKYMWLRTFALPTGEDPDKISSAELDAREKEEKEKAEKQKAEGTFMCSSCGREITAVAKRDGSLWDPASIFEYSKLKYGKPMCNSCMKKVKA